MIYFRRTDKYKEGFCDREPGELQTGLNRLWKMVREELLSSLKRRGDLLAAGGKGAARYPALTEGR
ncbi:hypothetical protein [Paenibacillus ihumii]|uniref:hypothetical protein n=1 Tax=Paenibacillus ihumii TaxID=687436 RepID=UPI0006D80669|nr:hypothetical protein [Paenibacillus ihumii]